MCCVRLFVIKPYGLFCVVLCSANNNWQTNFASINQSNENSPQANKKQRYIGESARDSLAYSCLLKNELLGTAIDDVKSVSEERNENNVMGSARRGLFKYQSPSKQVSEHVNLPVPTKTRPPFNPNRF